VRPAPYQNEETGKDIEKEGRYVLHTDLVKTLTRLRARMLLSTSSAAAQIASGARQGGALGASVPQVAADLRGALPSPTRQLSTGSAQARSTGANTSAFDDLRAGAEPPFADADVTPYGQPPMAAVPAATPTAPLGGDHAVLQREFVEHFAREMGQQEGTIQYLLSNNGLIDVERLWTALDLVLQKDDAGLRRPLVKAMKSIERSIDDARAQYPAAQLMAPGAAAQLNDFADRLKSMTVVMVMLPGAAYDNLINKMDAELEADKGAGRLPPALVEKHRIIVRHRSELARAEYSEDHWDSIVQSLMKFHSGLDQIAVDRPPNSMA
jgi:hypothetical protein